jgi:multisubunit Na+/H+ antiporter MnhB subunit
MVDMKFWKEHTALRLVLMLITFVLGLFLLVYGWKQTGQLGGLGLMLVGVALLLAALALYNKPFEDPKKR